MLPCLSCKEPVAPDKAKVFRKVFLCARCHRIATRLYEKGRSELKMMLLVLEESICTAALHGDLNLSFEHLDTMKREDLMSHLARLADEIRKQAVPVQEEPCPPLLTRSQVPLLPSARTADGKPSSD